MACDNGFDLPSFVVEDALLQSRCVRSSGRGHDFGERRPAELAQLIGEQCEHGTYASAIGKPTGTELFKQRAFRLFQFCLILTTQLIVSQAVARKGRIHDDQIALPV